MNSNKELSLSGKFYNWMDPELVKLRNVCAYEFLPLLTNTVNDMKKSVETKQMEVDALCHKYLGSFGKGSIVIPPFSCEYGCFTHIGNNSFVNMNCTFLDENYIYIEDDVKLGPNVGIYTAAHPVRYKERTYDLEKGIGSEYALPVRIKKGVWVGAGAIILPGITVGCRAVVGAGSVVTHDVPDDAIVAGNPARILRIINQDDVLNEENLREELANAKTEARKIIVQHTLEEQKFK